MDLTVSLVLPADVRLDAVEDLPPSTRTWLGPEARGYLVHRDGGRSGTSLVTPDVGLLLLAFRVPRAILDALESLPGGWGEESDKDRKSCFRILNSFIQERILVPVDDPAARSLEASLDPGDRVAGFRVVHALRVSLESEVYRVESPDGVPFALKLARPSSPWGDLVRGEGEALDLLGGQVAPRLEMQGAYKDRYFIVAEWIDGDPLDLVAADHRMGYGSGGSHSIWQLCGHVLDVYSLLHSKGVMHGDVRPANVLVTDSGEVRVIDFGFWQGLGGRATPSPPRAGTDRFLDPGFARSLLEGTPAPPLHPIDEQYSLASLLFLMCTGEHYCRFGSYLHEIRTQIVTAPPRTFGQAGAPAWPEAERLLRRGLEKRADDRFASLAEMAEQWHQIPAGSRGMGSSPRAGKFERFLSTIRDRLGLESGFPRELLGEGPTASVNRGAGGIAYGLYRISRVTDDPDLLASAQVWLSVARDESRRRRGFCGPDDPDRPTGPRTVSPHHSRNGIRWVRALLGRAIRDRVEERRGIREFIDSTRVCTDQLDVIHGRAGLLLGVTSLLELRPLVGRESLTSLGQDAVEALLERVSGPHPIPDQPENLGVAHGWAGLLYALLRWYLAANRTIPTSVHDRIQELTRLAWPGKRGIRWPWEGEVKAGKRFPHMAGWCNGSAGFVHLFSLAWETFGDEGFLETAEGAGWDVWESRQIRAYDLCCGLSGRAYSLLRLHRCTGEMSWLEKAQRLAERAVEEVNAGRENRFPNSLYRGEMGVAVLAAELERPEEATMPLFEPEDWLSI